MIEPGTIIKKDDIFLKVIILEKENGWCWRQGSYLLHACTKRGLEYRTNWHLTEKEINNYPVIGKSSPGIYVKDPVYKPQKDTPIIGPIVYMGKKGCSCMICGLKLDVGEKVMRTRHSRCQHSQHFDTAICEKELMTRKLKEEIKAS